jgi:hypothetical protein
MTNMYVEQILNNQLILEALDNFVIPRRTIENNTCFTVDNCEDRKNHPYEVFVIVGLPENSFILCEDSDDDGSMYRECSQRSDIAMVGFEHDICHKGHEEHFSDSKLFDTGNGICVYRWDRMFKYCMVHWLKREGVGTSDSLVELEEIEDVE